jgi:hypothetical protein
MFDGSYVKSFSPWAEVKMKWLQTVAQ